MSHWEIVLLRVLVSQLVGRMCVCVKLVVSSPSAQNSWCGYRTCIVHMPIHSYSFVFVVIYSHVVAQCRRIDASVTYGMFIVAGQGAGRQTTGRRKQTSHICTLLAQAMLRVSAGSVSKSPRARWHAVWIAPLWSHRAKSRTRQLGNNWHICWWWHLWGEII